MQELIFIRAGLTVRPDATLTHKHSFDMARKILLTILCAALCLNISAQRKNVITVDFSNEKFPVQPTMYGVFFEDMPPTVVYTANSSRTARSSSDSLSRDGRYMAT